VYLLTYVHTVSYSSHQVSSHHFTNGSNPPLREQKISGDMHTYTILQSHFYVQNSIDIPSQNEAKPSAPISAQLTPQTNSTPQSLESMLQQADLKGNTRAKI